MIQNNVLSYPLAQKKYNYTKPDFYQIGDVYYFLPHYNTLITPEFAPLLDVFNKFKEIETVYEFKDNLEAWAEFLNSLPSFVLSEKTYDKYIMQMNKMHSPFSGTQGTEIPVYHYQDAPYDVPTYETLRKKYSQLFPLWKKIIIDKKTYLPSKSPDLYEKLRTGDKPLITETCNIILNKMNVKYGGYLEVGHMFPYKTDGLIFLPNNLAVFQTHEDDIEHIKNPFQGGTWKNNYKWKPTEHLSIDFKIEFIKDLSSSKLNSVANLNTEPGSVAFPIP